MFVIVRVLLPLPSAGKGARVRADFGAQGPQAVFWFKNNLTFLEFELWGF